MSSLFQDLVHSPLQAGPLACVHGAPLHNPQHANIGAWPSSWAPDPGQKAAHPIVVMKLGVKESSENLSRMQLLPTPAGVYRTCSSRRNPTQVRTQASLLACTPAGALSGALDTYRYRLSAAA